MNYKYLHVRLPTICMKTLSKINSFRNVPFLWQSGYCRLSKNSGKPTLKFERLPTQKFCPRETYFGCG